MCIGEGKSAEVCVDDERHMKGREAEKLVDGGCCEAVVIT